MEMQDDKMLGRKIAKLQNIGCRTYDHRTQDGSWTEFEWKLDEHPMKVQQTSNESSTEVGHMFEENLTEVERTSEKV